MQTSDLLSRPSDLGPLTTKNRIVMPPLVIWKSDQSGRVVKAHVEHYARSVGPGLMIVEATAVAPDGRLAQTQLGIWSDDHVAGLSRLTDTVHSSGGLAGIQIHHAGASSSLEKNYGMPPRVPSKLEHSPEGATEMTGAEVEDTVTAFADATTRAIAAGFDVIELHGAHGYLIAQFLSPACNKRTDTWGGSAERRRAFMTAVIRAARERVDNAADGTTSHPVALTIRLGLAASGKRALSLEEGLAAAETAVAAGVDAVHVSHAGGIDDELAGEIRNRARGIVGPEAATTLEPTLLLAGMAKRRVDVPIIGVGGILTPEAAEAAIELGLADLVAIGRGILADPMWARKALGDVDSPIEVCHECKPRCFWFKEPHKCPARSKLARTGEQPALA